MSKNKFLAGSGVLSLIIWFVLLATTPGERGEFMQFLESNSLLFWALNVLLLYGVGAIGLSFVIRIVKQV